MSKFKLLDRVVVDGQEEVLTVVEVNPQTVFFNAGNSSISSRNSGFIGQMDTWRGGYSPFSDQDGYYKLAYSNGTTTLAREREMTLVGSPKKQLKYDLLKMYVLVKNTAPIGLGINAVGHVTFMAAQRFTSNVFKEWNEKSFRKVTCLVSPEEFDAAIEAIREIDGKYVAFNENDWGNQDLSVAFEPRYSFPDIFKTFKLHGGVA